MIPYIKIPIHSFVDLITNSSSEIFVSATNSTVTAAKKLIDSILTAGGSRFRCDDLFDVSVGDNPAYDEESQAYYESNTGSRKKSLTITPKTDSVAAKEAADVLKSLVSTFNIREYYNG